MRCCARGGDLIGTVRSRRRREDGLGRTPHDSIGGGRSGCHRAGVHILRHRFCSHLELARRGNNMATADGVHATVDVEGRNWR